MQKEITQVFHVSFFRFRVGDGYRDNCPTRPFFRQLGGARTRVEESPDSGKVTARICQVERERERERGREREGDTKRETERGTEERERDRGERERQGRERHKEKEKGDKEREVV